MFFTHNERDRVEEAMRLVTEDTTPELISEISPFSPIKYNSVNVALGRKGSGKTFAFMQEFIRIARDSERTHLLVYITKNIHQVDQTFQRYRQLLELPIQIISTDEAEMYLKNLIMCKNVYERIVNENLYERTLEEIPETIETLIDTLHIHSFDIPNLHTLIFIDDCVNSSILRPKSYLTSLLGEARHPKFSFFLCIQFWKGILPEIKTNLNTLFIFPHYSREQLAYVFRQISCNERFETIWEAYRTLDGHSHIVVDCDSGDLKIRECF